MSAFQKSRKKAMSKNSLESSISIEAQIKEFLGRGGKIDKIPNGVSGQSILIKPQKA